MTATRFWAGALLLALAAAGGSRGQEKDPQAKVEPRSGPGAGQKFLARLVGDWTVAKAFYPRGGGEPARATGTCRQTMVQDGRFLQSKFVFDLGGKASTGLGLIGFEPETGKFTSVWIDARQTRMSFRQGADPFDGKEIVLYSKTLGGEATKYRSRTVTRLEDDGRRIVHRQYNPGPDGQERLLMELILTRKGEAAPGR